MTDDVLSKYIDDRALVSIKRESIDHRTLQALPLAYSNELLCVYYVSDFRLDGLLFLRRLDISSIQTRATDHFQLGLLNDAGLLPEYEKIERFPLDSFTSILTSLPSTEIAIVECESLEEEENFFSIGRFAGCDADDFIALHEFSGAANWDDDLTKHAPEEITCVQLRNNYIHHYQKYFDRIGFPPIPDDE
ncbi:MAG: hypothetical protein AAGA25_14010 [Planctomycetota bacterium]